MNKGFTLAEMLLTLLIIGIISSLVIPEIIQDTQRAELKTAWKKTYSSISQASLMIRNEAGGDLTGYISNSMDGLNKYSKYMNFTKICGYVPNECWFWNNTSSGYKMCYDYDGKTPVTDWGGEATGILSNGVLINFWQGIPIRIIVDINGFKGPNTYGKDIFVTRVQSNGQVKPSSNYEKKFLTQ
jgi:prepilin-type N-terminal cleavage/methylation domain-containing protein